MKILVDADSCPREAREMILRFSSRLGIKTIFAANRPIPGIRQVPRNPQNPEIRKNPGAPQEMVVMEICPPGEGSADRRIAELAEKGDLAITRDVPLAEKLVESGIVVLDDRGRVFTKENIRELRSLRDFAVGLADNGMETVRTASYGKKDLNIFANSLDREIIRLRGNGSGSV